MVLKALAGNEAEVAVDDDASTGVGTEPIISGCQ